MSYDIFELFAYSIIIAAVIGAIRWRQLPPDIYPFLILLWAGVVNELVTTIVLRYYRSNALTSNIYTLVEANLLAWQFYEWKALGKSRSNLFWLITAITVLFIIDNFFISTIHQFNSYFRVGYSFLIVLLSIYTINSLFVSNKRWKEKRTQLLLLSGFIVYFGYQSLVEIFWIYGLNASADFRLSIYQIMFYINLAVNLLFAVALLWMPRKKESLLPLS